MLMLVALLRLEAVITGRAAGPGSIRADGPAVAAGVLGRADSGGGAGAAGCGGNGPAFVPKVAELAECTARSEITPRRVPSP